MGKEAAVFQSTNNPPDSFIQLCLVGGENCQSGQVEHRVDGPFTDCNSAGAALMFWNFTVI